MALTKKDLGTINSCVKSLTGGVETLHAAVVYGIKKAYSAADDKGEFLRELVTALPVSYLSPVVHFLRRAGINANMNGKTAATVGGAIDPKKQRNKIEWATSAAGDLLALVAADIPAAKVRTPKEKTGTFAEQADKVLGDLVKRQKKVNPDVAAVINQRLQKPSWFATFEGEAISADEAEMMVNGLHAYRAKLAQKLLKAA